MNEHKTVFLKRQNLIFSLVAGSICFAFWFLTKHFYKQDLEFPVTLGGQGGRDLESWYIEF